MKAEQPQSFIDIENNEKNEGNAVKEQAPI